MTRRAGVDRRSARACNGIDPIDRASSRSATSATRALRGGAQMLAEIAPVNHIYPPRVGCSMAKARVATERMRPLRSVRTSRRSRRGRRAPRVGGTTHVHPMASPAIAIALLLPRCSQANAIADSRDRDRATPVADSHACARVPLLRRNQTVAASSARRPRARVHTIRSRLVRRDEF